MQVLLLLFHPCSYGHADVKWKTVVMALVTHTHTHTIGNTQTRTWITQARLESETLVVFTLAMMKWSPNSYARVKDVFLTPNALQTNVFVTWLPGEKCANNGRTAIWQPPGRTVKVYRVHCQIVFPFSHVIRESNGQARYQHRDCSWLNVWHFRWIRFDSGWFPSNTWCWHKTEVDAMVIRESDDRTFQW